MNCSKCGHPLTPNAAFCEYCGQNVAQSTQPQQQAYQQPAPQQPVKAEKPENVVTGTVGAILGAALGGGSIILLSQLGYMAAISGIILAVCTLKGYELLGGKLSVKGMIISLLLILVTPYLADRIDWAIVICKAYSDYGVTFADAFHSVHDLIEEGSIDQSSYTTNLLMLYGFCALGAFSTVAGTFKKKK